MSIAIFTIGVIVFAITVYGTVIAGGLALTRRELDDNALLRARVDKDPKTGLPGRGKY